MKPTQNQLFHEIKSLIETTRNEVSDRVNKSLIAMYWHIGSLIQNNILNHKRAQYGEQTIKNLSNKLTNEFGRGWSAKTLHHCLHFVETFPDYKKVSTQWRQLSWSHFKYLFYIKDELQRDFYTQMCQLENWTVRQLKQKLDGMLFERTAISQKPEKLVKQELKALQKENTLSPDLVFKNPYVLDFLNLKDTYSEKDLESAILQNIETFILELGVGFSFVARQKRMTIDNEDFYLDLLFYHRKLQSLVAIELKLGKFKAAYKGQMELYLRWLEKHESQGHEKQPIGLILCAQSGSEQIELLQLDKSNIKVAEYLTQELPTKLLQKKLKQFYQQSQSLIDNQ